MSGDKAERAQILDDFAAGGALPGDDQRVVIGRDQNSAAPLRDLLGDRLAVIARAVIEHDLGAERRGALAFRARGIMRHDDDAAHAEKPRRRRDALGMIAGRESHHAAGALLGRNCRELVIRAAEFERTGMLQGLRLEEYAAAGHRIERGRGEERRMQRDAGEPAGRFIDVCRGR